MIMIIDTAAFSPMSTANEDRNLISQTIHGLLVIAPSTIAFFEPRARFWLLKAVDNNDPFVATGRRKSRDCVHWSWLGTREAEGHDARREPIVLNTLLRANMSTLRFQPYDLVYRQRRSCRGPYFTCDALHRWLKVLTLGRESLQSWP
jgi:hypothetical protein